MRIMFGHWKYIARNIWAVLPFAIVPAVFLALSLDYVSIGTLVEGFFTGNPHADFLLLFRALSIIRIDSVAGGLFGVGAFISTVFFMALLLAVVEKHMRIGKRTLSGISTQFLHLLGPVFGVTLFYTVLYEIWAVVLSALLFVVSALDAVALVYVLFCIVFVLFLLAFLYVVSVFYLWLPCKQITGFGAYDALLYSYRLLGGVRRRLVFSLLLSLGALFAILIGCSFLPVYVFWAIAFIAYVFLFLSFSIRMETVYFATDKLDREDLIRSYREL